MFVKHCPAYLSKSNLMVSRILTSKGKLKTKVVLKLGPLSEFKRANKYK